MGNALEKANSSCAPASQSQCEKTCRARIMYMLCDTNILIEYLKNNPVVVSFILGLQRARQPLFVSVITITEILAYPPITPAEYARITQFLSEIPRRRFGRLCLVLDSSAEESAFSNSLSTSEVYIPKTICLKNFVLNIHNSLVENMCCL